MANLACGHEWLGQARCGLCNKCWFCCECKRPTRPKDLLTSDRPQNYEYLGHGKEKAKARYERWWLGKFVRLHGYGKFKRVVGIRLIGPPSFVYGCVVLTFEDGTESNIASHAYVPRKMDVEVKA